MTHRTRLALIAATLVAACSPGNDTILFATDVGFTDIQHPTDVARTDGGMGFTDGSGIDVGTMDASSDLGPPGTCSDGGLVCGASCVNGNTDPNNCGTCGNACNAGQVCQGGDCVANPCPGNQYPCTDNDAGISVCTSIMTDPNNCGACGVVCTTGMTCAGGACFVMCTAPLIRCGATCSNLTTDPMNCGACSHACSAGETCSSNMCVCSSPFTTCGSACTNVQSDASNCGTCGNACGSGSYCSSGTCVACNAPNTLCAGNVCTNTNTDSSNCGSCGRACSGASVCTAGSCTCSASAGLTMCGTSCTDTQTDSSNCGSCGTVCPSGMSCASGSCGITTHYSATSSPAGVSFIDACGTAGSMTFLSDGLDTNAQTPLPFAFRYWTTNISAGSVINLCTNGFIGMDGSPLSTPSGSIPTGGPPFAIIAPHWGSNDNTSPGQCVATLGGAPFRKWVAEWQNDYYCCTEGSTSLTYEVILSETSNTIDFVYGTMTDARSQTAGIGDYTGAMGLGACPGGATTCAPTTGMTVRFLPIP